MRLTKISLAVLASLVALPTFADIPEIIACAEQPDPKARLACYDAATIKLKADLAAAQSRKLSLFGFTLPFSGPQDAGSPTPPEPVLGPKEVIQITAKLAGAIKDPYGHVIMTLDNGQVWKIQDQTLVPLGAARENGVVITRNMMGGFYLSVAGQENDLTVIRLR